MWLTLFAIAIPIFYVFHRAGEPEIFNPTEFSTKIVGAVLISIMVWMVYGIFCLFASSRTVIIEGQRVPKNCGNCEFSEKTLQSSKDCTQILLKEQDTEQTKCCLTGYNYPIDFACSDWKLKQAFTERNPSLKDDVET